jgi:hypothetical protein
MLKTTDLHLNIVFAFEPIQMHWPGEDSFEWFIFRQSLFPSQVTLISDRFIPFAVHQPLNNIRIRGLTLERAKKFDWNLEAVIV